ncbi:MAG: segregation/condensation protein A [Deltaproteobacteria bacterium]|nr:segregation/condensation protein A [Deltaproteobacteria bacterium]
MSKTLNDTNQIISEVYEGINLGANFKFDLDFFSGPLDLLLHLVRTEEVSIEEIQMSVIADKYLEIVNQSKFVDLDKAAEYLVIATTLMAIKSQSILSKNEPLSEEDDQYQGSDFYEQLRERLKQYELTKLRAERLRALPQLNIDTFARLDKKVLEPVGDEIFFEKTDSSFLVNSFLALLKRIGETTKTLLVKFDHISIVNYMMKIIDDLATEQVVNLFSLIKKYVSNIKNQDSVGVRSVLVGSFVAMLELVKRGLITARQDDNDSDITINLSLQSAELNNKLLDSEFDKAV